MRFLLTFLLLTSSISIFSQTAPAPTAANPSLKNRYTTMKTTSQTFKEYKVIKETVLDEEWRIVADTLAALHKQLHEVNAEITRLGNELKNVNVTLQQKEASTARIEFEADHINFFGMNFGKAIFSGIVILVFAGLLLLLGLLIGRLKIMFKVMREKNELMEMTGREFEEYKRNALEKQMKLSRELQNERNKLQEIKRV